MCCLTLPWLRNGSVCTLLGSLHRFSWVQKARKRRKDKTGERRNCVVTTLCPWVGPVSCTLSRLSGQLHVERCWAYFELLSFLLVALIFCYTELIADFLFQSSAWLRLSFHSSLHSPLSSPCCDKLHLPFAPGLLPAFPTSILRDRGVTPQDQVEEHGSFAPHGADR